MPKYREAGVNIDSGDQFVDEIAPLVQKTRRAEVLADLGGFAGLFALQQYKNPVLVSSTDGVGTKIKLANELQNWKGIGIDCVAMCVNDIGCFGAEPLFFLDYLAAGKLNPALLKEVVSGMTLACREVGCSLLGGETAEMPGVYSGAEWDCAGFAVGVVEREKIIDGKTIVRGDVVIGVASSGFHSNGFSLIRRILESEKMNLKMTCSETGLSLAETLLTPTKLYTPLILKLRRSIDLKGIAHITGGGLLENPPRILPAGVQIALEAKSWPIPAVMEMFRERGGLDGEEFYRVFNAGIGLVLIVAEKDREKTLKGIHDFGEKGWAIGAVLPGETQCRIQS